MRCKPKILGVGSIVNDFNNVCPPPGDGRHKSPQGLPERSVNILRPQGAPIPPVAWFPSRRSHINVRPQITVQIGSLRNKQFPSRRRSMGTRPRASAVRPIHTHDEAWPCNVLPNIMGFELDGSGVHPAKSNQSLANGRAPFLFVLFQPLCVLSLVFYCCLLAARSTKTGPLCLPAVISDLCPCGCPLRYYWVSVLARYGRQPF